MLNWLRRIFIGCRHEWITIQKVEAKYVRGGGEITVWVQQCRKCGAMHNHRLG
jgi:hypothetical protein